MWLMQLFVKAGFDKDSLRRLNRVWVHQQVLFLSCVLTASGKTLDSKFLRERKPLRQELVQAQISQGERTTQRLPSVGSCAVQDHLGRVQYLDYNMWNWRWDTEGQHLLHLKGDKIDVYIVSNLPRTEGVANR